VNVAIFEMSVAYSHISAVFHHLDSRIQNLILALYDIQYQNYITNKNIASDAVPTSAAEASSDFPNFIIEDSPMPERTFLRRLPLAPIIAGVGIVVSFLLIPIEVERDKLVVTDRHTVAKDQTVFIVNADEDPGLEQVRLKHNLLGNAAVCIDDDNLGTIEQYNLEGKFLDKAASTFCYLPEGIAGCDVFTLTMDEDTLKLHLLLDIGGSVVRSTHPVDTIHGLDTISDLNLTMYSPADLTGDSIPEIIFTVNAGFRLHPRRVYSFDRINGLRARSPDLGNKVGVHELADITGDGLPEIFLRAESTGNYSATSYGLHDLSAYLIVLTSSLQPLFKPMKVRDKHVSVTAFPFNYKGNANIAFLHRDRVLEDQSLGLADQQGTFILEMQLPQSEGKISNPIPFSNFAFPGTQPLIADAGTWWHILPDFSISQERSQNACSSGSRFRIVKSQGVPRYLKAYDAEEQRHWLMDSRTQRTVSLEGLNPCNKVVENVGMIPGEEHSTTFFLQFEGEVLSLSWQRNPWYPWAFLHYPAIALFWFGLVMLIQYVTRMSLQETYETRQRLQTLELLTIKNQITPHFAFNAINSIGSLIYREHKELAYRYLGQFSDLLRSSLQYAEKVSVPLEQEIGFVRNYLELEKLRFDRRFGFRIIVEDDSSLQVFVPKMALQIHIENAIKHGIMPLKNRNGYLEVRVKGANGSQSLVMEVMDNGIGRQAAARGNTAGTGRGMLILEQLFAHYEETYQMRINQKITDLKTDTGEAAGTLVKIIIERRNGG
jgi:hypothetical protein